MLLLRRDLARHCDAQEEENRMPELMFTQINLNSILLSSDTVSCRAAHTENGPSFSREELVYRQIK